MSASFAAVTQSTRMVGGSKTAGAPLPRNAWIPFRLSRDEGKVFWVADSRIICSDGQVLAMLKGMGKSLVASTRNGAWRSVSKTTNVKVVLLCAGLVSG